MAESQPTSPILILGAGISGLLLAQYLRKSHIPFRIFERDTSLDGRGLGWGLTLHWSLPALRSLLPEDLSARLPETYVDRAAVERGDRSTFPFYDLHTGEKWMEVPHVGEQGRIRVTRAKLKALLKERVDVEWNKCFSSYTTSADSVTVSFEDGTSATGSLLVASDGASSRVRRQLLPNQSTMHKLPIGIIGVRTDYSPEDSAAMRKLDPFFLHSSDSTTNIFAYFSVLDAPGNSPESSGKYSYQMVTSWALREGFDGKQGEITKMPETNEKRLALVKRLASEWQEPFRSFAEKVPDACEAKGLELYDWQPPKSMPGQGRVVLMGDAFHAMTMYRGEGANHAIMDVLDFVDKVGPQLSRLGQADNTNNLRNALDDYESTVIDRARPAVLASRHACMDAHDWHYIRTTDTPLLSRRAPKLDYPEDDPRIAPAA